MRKIVTFLAFFLLLNVLVSPVLAQTDTPRATTRPVITPAGATTSAEATDSADATASAEVSPTPSPTPVPTPRTDITQPTESTVTRLEQVLREQHVGSVLPFNFLKYGIRSAVDAGVPPNTIVLLLLLPLVIAAIAGARHVVGIRGFGIFLPASLAIVFSAIGPVVGIGLFMVIVLVSTFTRILLKKLKLKLQYLPRMSLILWFVVVGVLLALFLAPLIRHPDFTNVSIFPVLILVLLAEDFSKVQLGKSPRTAIGLASETIILSLVSYIFLTFEALQEFALLNPELILVSVMIFDLVLGRYFGLRFVEFWRYRKLIMKEK